MALLLRFADCQPILLYDPVRHALGLVHAGWRGVALGIARRAVEAMQEAFGTQPKDLVAGLGPAIGPCCYTVGHEVAAAMGYALPDWSQVMQVEGEATWRLDLSAANAQLLAAAGVRQIEAADLCTSLSQRRVLFPPCGRRHAPGALPWWPTSSRGPGPGRPPSMELPRQEPDRRIVVGVDSLHPPGFPALWRASTEAVHDRLEAEPSGRCRSASPLRPVASGAIPTRSRWWP